MMNCPNCGQPIDSDARFCSNCGATIPQEAQYTDYSADAENTAAAINNAPVADAMPSEATAPAQPTKKPPFKLNGITAIIAAAVIAVLVVVLVLSAVLQTLMHPADGIVYMRDGELVYASSSGKNTVRLTDEFNEADLKLYKLLNVNEVYSWLTAVSQNGKRIFYVDHVDEYGDYELWYRDLKNAKGDATKVDSNVLMYSIDKAGKNIIYLKTNGSGETKLYRMALDNGDKEKIKDNVTIFYTSEDMKKVVFLTDEDDLYVWTKKDGCLKLSGDVSFIHHLDDKFSMVYYEKNGALYKQNVKKDERDKIASSLLHVVHVYDSGEMYYLTRDENGDKLYYYDGAESKKLSDNLTDFCVKHELIDEGGNYPAAFYKEEPRIIYREVSGPDECTTYLAIKGDSKEMEGLQISDFRSRFLYDFTWAPNGRSLYFLSNVSDTDNDAYDIYQFNYSFGVSDRAILVDTDQQGEMLTLEESNNKLTYFKNVEQDSDGYDQYGELYVNGRVVDYDVMVRTCNYDYYHNLWLDSKTLVYCTDWDEKDECGTLKLDRNGKKTKIADDVHDFIFTEDGTVFYIADYETKSMSGTLYCYRNGKSSRIADDVNGFIASEAYNLERYRLSDNYDLESNNVYGFDWVIERYLRGWNTYGMLSALGF